MSESSTNPEQWDDGYEILFNSVPCYVTVIDRDFRIVRANDAFHDSFGYAPNIHCYEVYKHRDTKCRGCPAEKTFGDSKIHRSNQVGVGKKGQKIYYTVRTSALKDVRRNLTHVIEISNDVTPLRKLEERVRQAERLGAVGQTVAGLAHSIKNILMGLEGGKYIVSLGLEKNNKEMINQGWEMLERNFDKTTSLVKDFLSFSKGRLPRLEIVDPGKLVMEIVDLYKEVASRSSIELAPEIDDGVRSAPLDPSGIHTCLTNLVSNALDACLASDKKGTKVTIRVKEKKGVLIFQVEDNGSGIDYEIKKKIFTTFFTTKGGGGTGLGLLTTRKIIEEHGGTISVVSQSGKGARFEMHFPRKRLLELYRQSTRNSKGQPANSK